MAGVTLCAGHFLIRRRRFQTHTRSVSRGRPRLLPCPLRPEPPLLLVPHSRRIREVPQQLRCPHGPSPGQLGPWQRQPHVPSLMLARGRSRAACHSLQLQVGHTRAPRARALARARAAPRGTLEPWRPRRARQRGRLRAGSARLAVPRLHRRQRRAARRTARSCLRPATLACLSSRAAQLGTVAQEAQTALPLSSQPARMLHADGSTQAGGAPPAVDTLHHQALALRRGRGGRPHLGSMARRRCRAPRWPGRAAPSAARAWRPRAARLPRAPPPAPRKRGRSQARATSSEQERRLRIRARWGAGRVRCSDDCEFLGQAGGLQTASAQLVAFKQPLLSCCSCPHAMQQAYLSSSRRYGAVLMHRTHAQVLAD
jgi:hypothetical protein